MEFIGTTLTPQSPDTCQGEALHVRLPTAPDTEDHSLRSAQINPQIGRTPQIPAQKTDHPAKKIDEADKQEITQPTKEKHNSKTIHHGRIYRVGCLTYKFLSPQNQELVTVNGHSYLHIGTSQRKGTPNKQQHNRQPILLDLENTTAQATTPIANKQPLKETYKCPFTPKTDKLPTDAKLTPGQVYQVCSGATIKFFYSNNEANEERIGTVQYHKIRFTAVRAIDHTTSPHPHASQDPGHLHKDTPTSSPTHTGSQPTQTGSRPNIGHLEGGHLVTTQDHINDTNTVRSQQPSQEDAANNSTKSYSQATPFAAQQPKTKDMKQRPDAADAGNFLRRQIKSPGDFSRSNTKAFLKFENEMDYESIRNKTTAKRLRKKAPSKMSLASTLIRNTLLLHEDTQAGQCSRYQCQKPRACFLARRSKQATGSLYDSWKCYNPPPRREGQ